MINKEILFEALNSFNGAFDQERRANKILHGALFCFIGILRGGLHCHSLKDSVSLN